MTELTKKDVIEELRQAPERIYKAEKNLLMEIESLEIARRALEEKKNSLILSGAIDGKNAEIRNAQLDTATKTEREDVAARELFVSRSKASLDYERNRFAALKAIARLLAGEED